jgi:hypothetical protein
MTNSIRRDAAFEHNGRYFPANSTNAARIRCSDASQAGPPRLSFSFATGQTLQQCIAEERMPVSFTRTQPACESSQFGV